MMKKTIFAISFLLIGCGGDANLESGGEPPETHTFTFQGQAWQLTTPADWEILPPERQVAFMARKGSQNIAILERDLVNQNPVEQIISSAQNQFFAFTLNNRDDARWQFTGQPGPTNTPRTFWQEIKTVPSARKFLLASCSQIRDFAESSTCPAILNSWRLVPVEES